MKYSHFCIMKNAVVLGASPNPERYAYKAVSRLVLAGYKVFAVGKKKGQIGSTVIQQEWPSLQKPEIISLYLNPLHQIDYFEQIIASHPKKVIFNPGTENHTLTSELDKAGILWEEACTLVMLSTGAL
jgi:predicted CoA-binding protein